MRTVVDPDLRAVLAFLAVAEHGSFRGAARALEVPRSTLSQRVAALEEQLGVRLLARTTRSVRLTDAGVAYHRDAGPAVEALREAQARVVERTHEPAGQLRMTAPFELGQVTLGPVIATYAARHPAVRVVLDLVDRHVSLVEEGYDLAIRVGPLGDSQMISRRLGEPQRLGAYASASYLETHGRPTTPRELDAHRCLVMTGSREPTVWTFRRGLRITVRPDVAANSFHLLADLARRGAGIARLPTRYADGATLEEVLADHAPPARPLFAVYPSARHASAALRAMVDLLVESFAEHAACDTDRTGPSGSAAIRP